jgi:long-subunit fatty acid transport protein
MWIYKIISFGLIVGANQTFAQTHFKNTLIGDRAATMGGAYTAIADDASGSFYNPAGLALAQGNSLSGSANVYQINRSTYKNTLGDQDWERNSENLNPNFLVWSIKLATPPWLFLMLWWIRIKRHKVRFIKISM